MSQKVQVEVKTIVEAEQALAGLQSFLERHRKVRAEKAEEDLRLAALEAMEGAGFTIESPSASRLPNRGGFRLVRENRDGHVFEVEIHRHENGKYIVNMAILGTTDPSCQHVLNGAIEDISQRLAPRGLRITKINERWLTEREAWAHVRLRT